MDTFSYALTVIMPTLAYALAMAWARVVARHATSLERARAGTMRAATARETRQHIAARLARIAARGGV